MSFSVSQVGIGVATAAVFAVGSWGVSTEITTQSHDQRLGSVEDSIVQTEDTYNLILNELSYIRGKVDTIEQNVK